MEDLMMEENQIIYSKKNTTTHTMNKNSQTISKSKPKIRIIHIFAPEIIKTDAANFRELVQRLTGKPPPEDEDRNILRGGQKKTTTTTTVRKKETRIFASSNKKMENMAMMRAGFDHHHAEFRERIKGEEEIWSGANSGGGFLGGFAAEFDGFMQELNQFPFLEGTAAQVDVYGEPQLA